MLSTGLLGCAAARDAGLGYRDHPVAPAPPPTPSFAWPEHPGWRTETTRFPLPAAPQLPFRGIEARRVRDDGTAVIVWFLEDAPRLERHVIEASLKEYFGGADVHLDANVEPSLVGEVERDPPLHLKARTGTCLTRWFLVVSASPKGLGDPSWASLNEVAASFQCSGRR